MDQRSDYIRQDIESTRASLDEKLDTLETRARQAFDIKHHVAERPWMMIGAAMATGYVLGSMGGETEQRWHGQPYTTTDYNRHAAMVEERSDHSQSSLRSTANSFLSQFDDEIDMLKVAAVNMLTGYLRDTIKEYVPALAEQLNKQSYRSGQQRGTVSTAPGASRYADQERGSSSINNEGIPTTTSYGSNMADRAAEHATPYYPPGSSGDTRERSVGEESRTYS